MTSNFHSNLVQNVEREEEKEDILLTESDNNVPKAAFNQRYVSNFFDGMDKFTALKVVTPIQVVIGLGVLISAFLPILISLALAAVLILQPLLKTVFKSWGFMRNPHMDRVIHGKVTSRVEGDFCVLLIGARNNAPWKLSSKFAEVGRAFTGMIKELENLPVEKTGYMGAENFISTNMQRSSMFMTVIYWRSYNDLIRFAHDGNMTHFPTWVKASKMLKESADIGVWHEAYQVTGGQYDSVYVNCPPLGLGICGKIEPAVGHLKTSRGRSGIPK